MKKGKKKQIPINQKILTKFHSLFPTFIKSVPHHKHVFKTSVKHTLYFCLFSFLFLNIILSQLISPLYFQIMNDYQKAVVSYLHSIRFLPQFHLELLKFNKIYGKGFENDIFTQELQREAMIKKFEQILDKNLYSRDILYSLYLLYNEKGDKTKAEKYLRQAKNIDPMIE